MANGAVYRSYDSRIAINYPAHMNNICLKEQTVEEKTTAPENKNIELLFHLKLYGEQKLKNSL